MDEMLGSPDADEGLASSEARDAGAAKRGYSESAREGRQPPITRLIAKRPFWLFVLALGGLAAVAGVEALFAGVFHAPGVDRVTWVALDVAARGSLASWLGSLILLLAAANAVLVFWLRSHKLDDYRGRYRVWIWTAVALAIASVDSVTALHQGLGQLLSDRFTPELPAGGSTWGLGLLGLVYGALATRLAFETWASRLATALSGVALAGYLAAAAVQTGWLLAGSDLLAGMAQSALALVAHLSVAFGVAVYCRYVYLDAQGQVTPRPQRVRKPRKKQTQQKQKEEKATAAAAEPAPAFGESSAPTEPRARIRKTKSRTLRVDSRHSSPAEPAQPAPAAPEPVDADAADGADDDAIDVPDYDPETGRPLSKAERRRLRKQMRRQLRKGSGT